MNDVQRVRDFLAPHRGKPYRDPIWKHIYIPNDFLPVISSRPFHKLQGIRQLGPASLVYPGATHTRFNHSLGVFHVTTRFLERFLNEESYLRIATLEGAKAFLLAALLHDLGHFPFTHSLKELSLRRHEALSADILRKEPLASILRDGAGVDPNAVAAIVDDSLPCPSPELLFYRRVLSGVLDPDKLDYLNRDAYFCGVPYGVQDIDFILSQIFVHGDSYLGIREAGISAIEHLLFSKYLMYRSVYWHHTVRAATAMMKKAIFLSLRDGVLKTKTLYELDDEGFRAAARAGSGDCEALGLVGMVDEGRLFATRMEFGLIGSDGCMRAPLGLEARARAESEIARYLEAGSTLREYEVIVDVPEAISFEVEIPVESEGATLSYIDAETVFSEEVVRDFTARLRVVRLMLPQGSPEPNKVQKKHIEDILLEGARNE